MPLRYFRWACWPSFEVEGKLRYLLMRDASVGFAS
jgi:hypothetical protein